MTNKEFQNLRCNDWVRFEDVPYQISTNRFLELKNKSVNCLSFVNKEEISLIPITNSILEKNGFVSKGNNGDIVYSEFSDEKQDIYIRINFKYKNDMDIVKKGSCTVNKKFTYINELQNAMSICEIDKEIYDI